jgi:exopolysaccharide biosynthesis protein
MQYSNQEYIHVITISRSEDFKIIPILACGTILGTSPVTSCDALASINGGYFDGSGRLWGALKMAGVIQSTSSEYTRGISLDTMEFLDISSEVLVNGEVFDGVNIEGSKVIYTDLYGHNIFNGVNHVVVNGKCVAIHKEHYTIKKGETVVFTETQRYNVGDTIDIQMNMNGGSDVITCAPTLVVNGVVSISDESLDSDITNGRSPRTAIGASKDNIYMVVMDGRDRGQGATIEELANYMISLGCTDALNLDGGSSSQMVYNGKLMNNPGNPVRPVSTYLAVVRS